MTAGKYDIMVVYHYYQSTTLFDELPLSPQGAYLISGLINGGINRKGAIISNLKTPFPS